MNYRRECVCGNSNRLQTQYSEDVIKNNYIPTETNLLCFPLLTSVLFYVSIT